MNSKTVSMTAIGFSDHELRILKTVSSLSHTGRPYRVELSTTAPRQGLALFICNADDPEAMARWNVYRLAFPDSAVLMTSRDLQHSSPYPCIPRPLSARRLLDVLDGLFAAEAAEAPAPQAGARGERINHLMQRTVENLFGHTPKTQAA